MNAPIFHFDDWTLNPQTGELERGTARLRLQEHPLQVLTSLLENPGRVVTREELIARLWPSTVVDFDTGLNTAVRKLRAALGDTADTPRYIETIPRRGYRFIGTVRKGDSFPDSTPADAPVPPPRSRLVKLAIPLAVILAGLGVWLIRGGILHHPAGGSQAASSAVPPPHSVAVLPFVNMSGDITQEYFSDGLSEELLNALSRIDELQVAAQTSSFYFKGKAADLETIAHKLNVASVLEGSVRRSGHTVRITAQLIDATTGFHLWSQTYDRNADDALALQSDIANAVANALKVTLLNGAPTKIDLGGTRNPQALDAYLRGLKSLAATLRSAEEARETIATFTEAIRLDPNFALAYTARARALVAYGSYFMIDSTHEIFARAQADATQAVTLEPALGEGHAALAKALENGFFDFGTAAKEYERAMALSPGNVRVLLPYSRFASNMGRADVAITTAQRAVELDPLNMDTQRALGEALENARRYPEAVAAFEAAIKINPAHASQAYQRKGRLQYLMGDILAAKASCEAEPEIYHLQTCMPLIYEKLGQHAAARAALATAMEAQKDFSSYQYAQIYAQWGQPDQAMDWLDRGIETFDPGMVSMKIDPFLDPLRGLPRFAQIQRSLGFPP